MRTASSVLAQTMYVECGILPHQNLQTLVALLKKEQYREDGYKKKSEFSVGDKKVPVYFQEAEYGNGFRITGHDEVYLRKYGHTANNLAVEDYEELYVTGSGMILYIQADNYYYYSHLDETSLDACLENDGSPLGMKLADILSPEYKKALEAAFVLKEIKAGMTWEVNEYKVHACLNRISGRGNMVINSHLETPQGKKLELANELLVSLQKTDRIKSTVLHGIKDVVKCFESLINSGETPEIAIQVATCPDYREVKRRLAFIRQNPEMGIDVPTAICPGWYQGVGLINRISLSGYDEKAIANAIGFIGEPVKPTEHSLEYKTRDGADKPWCIELSYSSPDGGSGRYWFYLDGGTADAHNGNLETLGSSGDFGHYRSLLWIFLNPLKEMLKVGSK